MRLFFYCVSGRKASCINICQLEKYVCCPPGSYTPAK